MIYGELDLSTEERNAWQRGDYVRAHALALLIDTEEDAQSALQAETERADEAEANKERAESKLEDLKEVIYRLADALSIELEAATRCGNREGIQRQIDALYEAVK